MLTSGLVAKHICKVDWSLFPENQGEVALPRVRTLLRSLFGVG